MGNEHDRGVHAVIPGVGITYADFAKLIEEETNINLRVGMPAHVLNWRGPVSAGDDSRPALVDIQPHYIFSVAINTREELTAEERATGWTLHEDPDGYVKQRPLPVIRNVPVHYPGAAGMLIRGPLKAGEVGWTKIADRSIDKWTQTGGPVDPGFVQFHDLSDGVFEPGLRYGKIAQPIDESKWICGPESGTAGLEIDDVEAPNLPNISVRTDGDEALIDAAVTIKLGLAAALAAMRQTDPVNPGSQMTAWALVAETAINVLLPGTFTPANSFATTVAPANSGNFGGCGTGSAKTVIE